MAKAYSYDLLQKVINAIQAVSQFTYLIKSIKKRRLYLTNAFL